MSAVVFQYTPVEVHAVGAQPVYVKREDLCGLPPLPPLSKARGLHAHVSKLAARGVELFGVVDTRISKSGQAVAVICGALGVRCRYYFPVKKSEADWLTEPRRVAREHGAALVPMQAAKTGIVYARAKKDLAALGGWMLPLGFPVYETVLETADACRSIELPLLSGSVVMSTGTGTIMAGFLCHLLREELPMPRVVGVSASMSVEKQARTIARHLARFTAENGLSRARAEELLRSLLLVRGRGEYYEPSEAEMPFPGHPYYEGKAWEWMLENLDHLPRPVLFYNIGS